eukprot:COSAG05_NODE_137_length_16843_cov_121.090779_8_plen_75_part_00
MREVPRLPWHLGESRAQLTRTLRVDKLLLVFVAFGARILNAQTSVRKQQMTRRSAHLRLRVKQQQTAPRSRSPN